MRERIRVDETVSASVRRVSAGSSKVILRLIRTVLNRPVVCYRRFFRILLQNPAPTTALKESFFDSVTIASKDLFTLLNPGGN